MGEGWLTEDYDSYVEVKPIEDLEEHYAGDECWCKPKVKYEKDFQRPMIVHNSKDEREKYE